MSGARPGWSPRTLRGQLTLLFLALTLVPSLLLTTLVTRRLLDAVARWEQPGVQRALLGSFEVARDMMARTENDLLQRGQLLAADTVLQSTPDPAAVREELAASYNLDFVQLYDPEATLLFETTRDPLIAAPGPLNLVRETAGRPEPFLRGTDTGILAHVGLLGEPGEPERILVVGNYLGSDFYPRLDALSEAVTYYRQLPFYIRVNQRAALVLMGTVMLVLAGVAVAVARWLALRVSGPVEALGRGMQAVAVDSRPVRVEPRGSLEMERLIRTFNGMSMELARSREQLAQAERQTAWREMARRVAHEMRNALTPVSFSVHRVQKLGDKLSEDDRARLREAVDTVLEEVEGLKRLAASFGELARLPAPEMRPIDLADVLDAAIAAAREPGVALVWEPPPGGVGITGDRTLLRQAMTNLLRNASEALNGSGTIWVRLTTDAGRAMITVEDDGPGWPEADRGRVLQPYVTTKAAGTGLGLSLVQRTVFQHGGALHLEDRPGGGARVTLELPRSGRAAAPPEARIEDAS